MDHELRYENQRLRNEMDLLRTKMEAKEDEL